MIDNSYFYTATRSNPDAATFYSGGHSGDRQERNEMHLPAVPLQVYLGFFRHEPTGTTFRQVVIATRMPEVGRHHETFELVFEGSHAEAWDAFDAHVALWLDGKEH